jgi:hypothetical protein
MNLTKRKICLAILEAQNVMMWHLWAEYDRMLRWYGGGLTEKERVYLQKRSIAMKQVCEELSLFRDRLYQHLHGTPYTKMKHRERVRNARKSQSH